MIDSIKLEITKEDGGSFTLRCDERWEEHLTCDEALFVVATWIVNGRKEPPYLKTADEHLARETYFDSLHRDRLQEESSQLITVGPNDDPDAASYHDNTGIC